VSDKQYFEHREHLGSEEYAKAAERVLELLTSGKKEIRMKFEDERKLFEKPKPTPKSSKPKKVSKKELDMALQGYKSTLSRITGSARKKA